MLITFGGGQCADMPQGLPQSAACLSIDDVINIPLGNATGTVEWGIYRPVSNIRTSCTQCELNTVPESKCTESTLDPTVHSTFTQDGGRLTLTGPDGTTITGGINADGTFTIGTVGTLTLDDGTPNGQGLSLIEGAFVGNRIIVTGMLRSTWNEADGRTVDLLSVHSITLERVE